MKRLPHHEGHLLPIYVPIILLGLAIVWYATPAIILTLKSTWLILGLCGVVMLLPLGSMKLGPLNQAPRFTHLQWLIRMIVVIATTFLLLSLAWLLIFPTQSAQQNARVLYQNSGFFPWPIYALTAIPMGYLSFHPAHAKGYVSSFLKKLLGAYAEDCVSIGLDFGARMLIFFALLMTLSLCIIAATQAFAFFFDMGYLNHRRPADIFMFSCAMVILGNVYWVAFINKAFTHFNRSVVIILFWLIATGVFLLLAMAGNTLAIHASLLAQPFPFLVQKQNTAAAEVLFALYALSLTPFISVWIATISYGYRIRKVLCVTLGIIGIALSCNAIFLAKYHFVLTMYQEGALLITLSTLIVIGFAKLVSEPKRMNDLMRAHVPESQPEIKTRNSDLYLRNVLQIAMMMAVIFFMGGAYLLSIILFMLLFAPIVLIYMVIVAFFQNAIIAFRK